MTMPLAYFLLSWNAETKQAAEHAEHWIWVINNLIEEDPQNWQDKVSKLMEKTTSQHLKNEISVVKIYDRQLKLIYNKTISEPFYLDIRSRREIRYNNQIYGYAEVVEKNQRSHYFHAAFTVVFFYCRYSHQPDFVPVSGQDSGTGRERNG